MVNNHLSLPLNNSLSLVISFFTFKKEKVGGPPDWECERDAGAETPERKVATAHALTPTVAPLADTLNTLGKRVSKPPEKLIMETETETPQQATRTSKRAIRYNTGL